MKYSFALIILLGLFGCKKQIEQIQNDLVIQAMTTGQWKMVSFIDGSTDVSSNFAPYTFQFKTDYTVDAINNSAVETSGTWGADADAKTITSNFSTQANNPLPLLNGTWKITKNSWTYVEANMTVSGILRTLRLEKI
jgi:hypothetical protein